MVSVSDRIVTLIGLCDSDDIIKLNKQEKRKQQQQKQKKKVVVAGASRLKQFRGRVGKQKLTQGVSPLNRNPQVCYIKCTLLTFKCSPNFLFWGCVTLSGLWLFGTILVHTFTGELGFLIFFSFREKWLDLYIRAWIFFQNSWICPWYMFITVY